MWGPNMACGHALRGKILNALSLGWCALFLWGLLSLLKFGRGHQPLLQELEVGRAVSFIHEADLVFISNHCFYVYLFVGD